MGPLRIIIRHRSHFEMLMHIQRSRETIDYLKQRPCMTTEVVMKAVTMETQDGISNKNSERTSLKETNVRGRERDF